MEKQNLINELKNYMGQRESLLVTLAQLDGIITYLNAKLNSLENKDEPNKK
jgi:hypothetical protein